MAYEGLSEDAIKKILNHAMGKTAWTMPTVYVALYNGNPLVAGVELTDPPATGYARKTMICGSATFSSPTGTITNSSIVDFGTAGAIWGTVDYMAIFDQLTGGNMIASGPLATVRSVQTNDPVTFPIGNLQVRLTQTVS